MEYEVACACGKTLWVSEGMAGSSVPCDCGLSVSVPSLRSLRGDSPPETSPPPVLPAPPPAASPRRPPVVAEIIPPTSVHMRAEGGESPRTAAVVAALTRDALWIQDTWRLRVLPLRGLDVEPRGDGKDLALNLDREAGAERVTLTFPGADEAAWWARAIQEQRQLPRDTPEPDRPPPQGVTLVEQAREPGFAVVARLEFTARNRWEADRGLQLRAGMFGADAVVEVYRQKAPDTGWGGRHVCGVAVRVEDPAARRRLRLTSFAEQVRALVGRMLALLAAHAVLLFVGAVVRSGVSPVEPATGETMSESLQSVGVGLGLLYAWPLVILGLAWALRWPTLLRAGGLAVMAATTGRALTVWLAHLVAVWTSGIPLAESKFWIFVDPIDWAFVILGVVLCVRAWRLADDARRVLPAESQVMPTASRLCAGGLFAATCAAALAVLGWVGTWRYDASAHVLQPGVDLVKEQQALQALNEGAAQANRGQYGAAEVSFRRSLGLWEELTRRPSAPSIYRLNLSQTLYNLGWICHKQDRLDEAESFYGRAVKVADELAGDPQATREFQENIAFARAVLEDFRGGHLARDLEEKERKGARLSEEGEVKYASEPAEAARLYAEAIALWEEILPKSDNPDYRKGALFRLAAAHGAIGELRQRLGQRDEAEAALKKAIDYGEQAVALNPDRPLARHNLEWARRQLDVLREQELEKQVAEFLKADRHADAADLFTRVVQELEDEARSGKDRAETSRRLGYWRDKTAWFLAHCPDGRVRDTRAAVKHATRAAEANPDVADYWYTLATAQYRNGDWRDSLASLDRVKAKEGQFDASCWLLVAMNRHQLKQRDDAQAAMKKAAEWLEDQKRQAEGDAGLRLRLELIRPAIDALRREAEKLLEGKDPGGTGVG